MEPYRGGFLVTDGHHNRVLRVISSGKIIEVIRFDNIVPTGLATKVNDIYMAQAGPVPHVPADGKVVVFRLKSSTATEVASGEPLLVDVEFDSDSKLYALSQGDFVADPPGAPALPDTGALVEVKEDGSFTVIVDGLDRPTSLEFIGNTAYVITLGGEVWKIDGGSDLSFGESKAAPAVVTTNLNGVAAVRALDSSRESKAGPDGDDVRPPAGLAQPAPMTAEQQSAPCGPELATATVWARLSCR